MARKTNNETVNTETENNNELTTLVTVTNEKVTNEAIESVTGELVTRYTINLAIPTKSGLNKVQTMDAVVAHNVEFIQKLTDISESAELTKCLFMSEIAKNNTFKALGFDTMNDFSKHVFGIEKTATNAYVRIGQLFISGTVENPVLWEFLPLGYGKSHLLEIVNVLPTDLMEDIERNRVELLSIVEKLISDGVITSNMSTIAIRKALKEARQTVNSDGEKTYNLKEESTKGRKAKSAGKIEEKSEDSEDVETVDNLTVAKAVLISSKKSLEKCTDVINGIGPVEMSKFVNIMETLTELIAGIE